jgi:hypothetical protein
MLDVSGSMFELGNWDGEKDLASYLLSPCKLPFHRIQLRSLLVREAS